MLRLLLLTAPGYSWSCVIGVSLGVMTGGDPLAITAMPTAGVMTVMHTGRVQIEQVVQAAVHVCGMLQDIYTDIGSSVGTIDD
jgi:hypothetical protein